MKTHTFFWLKTKNFKIQRESHMGRILEAFLVLGQGLSHELLPESLLTGNAKDWMWDFFSAHQACSLLLSYVPSIYQRKMGSWIGFPAFLISTPVILGLHCSLPLTNFHCSCLAKWFIFFETWILESGIKLTEQADASRTKVCTIYSICTAGSVATMAQRLVDCVTLRSPGSATGESFRKSCNFHFRL